MTIPTSSLEQVIPGQGSMAQPEAAKRAKRRRFLAGVLIRIRVEQAADKSELLDATFELR